MTKEILLLFRGFHDVNRIQRGYLGLDWSPKPYEGLLYLNSIIQNKDYGIEKFIPELFPKGDRLIVATLSFPELVKLEGRISSVGDVYTKKRYKLSQNPNTWRDVTIDEVAHLMELIPVPGAFLDITKKIIEQGFPQGPYDWKPLTDKYQEIAEKVFSDMLDY